MVRYTIEGRLLVPPGRTSLELPFFYERVHQIGTEEKRELQLNRYETTWRSVHTASAQLLTSVYHRRTAPNNKLRTTRAA